MVTKEIVNIIINHNKKYQIVGCFREYMRNMEAELCMILVSS